MDLTVVVRAVADALEPVAQAKSVSLTCGCADELEIMGDRGWIERLLLNLLDNAIKFTRPGGAIAISVTRSGGMARLAVQDSGIGISADALPHIFERFYRADPSRSSATDGAALGLSLVKWIADRHAATIDVASRPGHGTLLR